MSLKRQFRKIKKFPHWIFYPLMIFIRLWFLTLRKKNEDPHGIIPRIKNLDPELMPTIPLIWHNRLLFFGLCVPAVERKKTDAVISASRDGQYIADLLRCFGVGAIRGSSSKKGLSALHGTFQSIEKKHHVCFTPDGPRGPCYHLSKGPIFLASKTGRPILPLAPNSSAYWQIKSWDRFQLPKPFSKLTLVWGKPIFIPPDLNDEEIEKWRQIVEAEMRCINLDIDNQSKEKNRPSV